eukprot:603322-Pelagomonas_calceolata.AAC.1
MELQEIHVGVAQEYENNCLRLRDHLSRGQPLPTQPQSKVSMQIQRASTSNSTTFNSIFPCRSRVQSLPTQPQSKISMQIQRASPDRPLTATQERACKNTVCT